MYLFYNDSVMIKKSDEYTHILAHHSRNHGSGVVSRNEIKYIEQRRKRKDLNMPTSTIHVQRDSEVEL